MTPLAIGDIDPGPHKIVVTNGSTTVTRTVNVIRGATSSVFLSVPAPAGPSAGWVVLNAPLELQVSEGGHLIGTTKAARIMLQAGAHTLELTNAELEFTTRISVQVPDGKTSTIQVPVPNGSLSVNAVP